MVEVMVVIVLVAIVVGLMAPRLTGWRGRSLEASAEAIAAVVSSAATRDQLDGQGLALNFENGRLSVMTSEFTDRGTVWRVDPMSPAADLGDLRLAEVTLDGSPLEPQEWRWELPQGERRPVLSIVIGTGVSEAYRIELGSLASTAIVLEPGSVGIPEESVDLDGTGRGDTSW